MICTVRYGYHWALQRNPFNHVVMVHVYYSFSQSFFWSPTLRLRVAFFAVFYLLLPWTLCEPCATVGSCCWCLWCRVLCQLRLLGAYLNQCSFDSSEQPESSEMKPCGSLSASGAQWLNRLQIVRRRGGGTERESTAAHTVKRDWRLEKERKTLLWFRQSCWVM